MVVKIASILTLKDLTIQQLRQIADVFKVKGKLGELGFSDLRTALLNSQGFKDRCGKYDADKVYRFCYGRGSNFVCTEREFSKTDHQFITPSTFRHDDINSSDKKKQVLIQLLKFDEDSGEAHLEWSELLLPQKKDVAEYFGININERKGGSWSDMLTKTPKYKETFGKSKLIHVRFMFHLSDPLVFRTASVPTEDSISDVSLLGENEETDSEDSQNRVDTDRQNKDGGKPTSSQGDDNGKANSEPRKNIPRETPVRNQKNKGKKVAKADLVKIYSISSVGDATIGQIKQIAELLGVNLEIRDPNQIDQMRKVVFDSQGFKTKFGDEETARLEDSLFCFDKNINLVCALVDFNEHKHTFVIPGNFQHRFITTNVQKLAVLRQSDRYGLNDLAHIRWEDLLPPQIWNIAKGYRVNMDQEMDDLSSWKQKIEKAEHYLKTFASAPVETLEFIFNRNDPYNCLKIKEGGHDSNRESTSNCGLHNNTVEDNNSTKVSNVTAVQEDFSVRRQLEGSRVICVPELDGHQFIELLDIFELKGKPSYDWNTSWNILQCSKYFLKKFGGCEAEEVQVVWKEGKIINVKTVDGLITMERNISLYPCVTCCREVTDNNDETGQGLQCDRCNRFVHNNCLDKPVSKQLYAALADSPDYVQIFCPDCMKSKGAIEKLSVDVDSIKKGMSEVSYASKVNNGLVQNVKRAVGTIESSAKILPRRMKEDPTVISRLKEEKLGRTVVVLRPKSNSNNSHEIRKEFNRKFPEVALVAAVPTASGSVRMEFTDSTTREDVTNKWDLGMFGGNAGVRTPTMKPTIGILKQVNIRDNTEDIKNEVEHYYPGTVLDFFKRNDQHTGTIKLTFKDHSTYTEVIDEGGLKIGGVKYRMEQFHMRAKVIRCYKCQSYGHIATRCRSKEARCGRCCKAGHESNTCKVKITNPTCIHCKGSHFTGSKDCQEFKLVEEKINAQYKYGS